MCVAIIRLSDSECPNSWINIKNASIKTATINIIPYRLHNDSLKCGWNFFSSHGH
ncbi:hypothetical protein [Helicobacter pylori]|uniref:hypothetical protein n=1 Tax=Helicobacter pylori TaxID=210 RepID=UPI0018833BE9|nr:hypothetical protein [Helicobacter pylori]